MLLADALDSAGPWRIGDLLFSSASAKSNNRSSRLPSSLSPRNRSSRRPRRPCHAVRQAATARRLLSLFSHQASERRRHDNGWLGGNPRHKLDRVSLPCLSRAAGRASVLSPLLPSLLPADAHQHALISAAPRCAFISRHLYVLVGRCQQPCRQRVTLPARWFAERDGVAAGTRMHSPCPPRLSRRHEWLAAAEGSRFYIQTCIMHTGTHIHSRASPHAAALTQTPWTHSTQSC